MRQPLVVRAPDTTCVAIFGPKRLAHEAAVNLSRSRPISGDCTGAQAGDQQAHVLCVPSPTFAGCGFRADPGSVFPGLFGMTGPCGEGQVWLLQPQDGALLPHGARLPGRLWGSWRVPHWKVLLKGVLAFELRSLSSPSSHSLWLKTAKHCCPVARVGVRPAGPAHLSSWECRLPLTFPSCSSGNCLVGL